MWKHELVEFQPVWRQRFFSKPRWRIVPFCVCLCERVCVCVNAHVVCFAKQKLLTEAEGNKRVFLLGQVDDENCFGNKIGEK